MTDHTAESNQTSTTYAIRVSLKDDTTYSFPFSSEDMAERDKELGRVDALIETGCRFIRIGDTRFPVNRIIDYRAYEYNGHLNGGPYFGKTSYYGESHNE